MEEKTKKFIKIIIWLIPILISLYAIYLSYQANIDSKEALFLSKETNNRLDDIKQMQNQSVSLLSNINSSIEKVQSE